MGQAEEAKLIEACRLNVRSLLAGASAADLPELNRVLAEVAERAVPGITWTAASTSNAIEQLVETVGDLEVTRPGVWAAKVLLGYSEAPSDDDLVPHHPVNGFTVANLRDDRMGGSDVAFADSITLRRAYVLPLFGTRDQGNLRTDRSPSTKTSRLLDGFTTELIDFVRRRAAQLVEEGGLDAISRSGRQLWNNARFSKVSEADKARAIAQELSEVGIPLVIEQSRYLMDELRLKPIASVRELNYRLRLMQRAGSVLDTFKPTIFSAVSEEMVDASRPRARRKMSVRRSRELRFPTLLQVRSELQEIVSPKSFESGLVEAMGVRGEWEALEGYLSQPVGLPQRLNDHLHELLSVEVQIAELQRLLSSKEPDLAAIAPGDLLKILTSMAEWSSEFIRSRRRPEVLEVLHAVGLTPFVQLLEVGTKIFLGADGVRTRDEANEAEDKIISEWHAALQKHPEEADALRSAYVFQGGAGEWMSQAAPSIMHIVVHSLVKLSGPDGVPSPRAR